MPYRVFISYAEPDRALAGQVAEGLRGAAHGWQVLAPGLGDGATPAADVDSSTADVVVALLTPAALHHRQIRAELDAARSRQVPIVPFPAPGVALAGDPLIATALEEADWVDAEADETRRIEQLVARIARVQETRRLKATWFAFGAASCLLLVASAWLIYIAFGGRGPSQKPISGPLAIVLPAPITPAPPEPAKLAPKRPDPPKKPVEPAQKPPDPGPTPEPVAPMPPRTLEDHLRVAQAAVGRAVEEARRAGRVNTTVVPPPLLDILLTGGANDRDELAAGRPVSPEVYGAWWAAQGAFTRDGVRLRPEAVKVMDRPTLDELFRRRVDLFLPYLTAARDGGPAPPAPDSVAPARHEALAAVAELIAFAEKAGRVRTQVEPPPLLDLLLLGEPADGPGPPGKEGLTPEAYGAWMTGQVKDDLEIDTSNLSIRKDAKLLDLYAAKLRVMNSPPAEARDPAR